MKLAAKLSFVVSLFLGSFCLVHADTLTLKPLSQVYALDASSGSAEVEFPIGGTGEIMVTVMSASVSNPVLELPNGTVVTEGNAGDHGVTFERFSPTNRYEQLFASSDALVVTAPALDGLFTLRVFAPAGSEAIPVRVEGGESGLRSGFVIGGGGVTATRGAKVSLSVALFEDQTPVQGARMSAQITDADGAIIASLTFMDDGEGADAAQGDGLYSAFFLPPASGVYFIGVDIKGTTAAGTRFAGREGGRLAVIEPDIRLTGDFTDEGVDLDGDGYFDHVTFRFASEGPRGGGEYSLTLVLEAQSGRQVDHATLIGDPSAPLAIDMPADRIKRLESDGPYQIASVILWHDATPLGRWDNLGESAPYRLDQLERKNTVLHPVHADRGVDLDGDGLFDRLDVTFDADVLIAGQYGVSGDLRGESEILDDAGLPSIYLQAGHNDVTLAFTGELIGRSGEDGPYRLTNVLVYPLFKASASALVDQLGTTQAYSCQQFAGCSGDAQALLDRLFRQIDALPLNGGLRNSLKAKLRGVDAALDKENPGTAKSASNKLRAFINEIVALRDKQLPREQADPLIEGANILLEVVNS